MDIIETKAITQRFGSLVAVNAVDMAIAGGEVFGLLGPNGAGKTTLIKMLTTLLPPTSGDAFVAGCSITKSAGQVRRFIGYVPQLISSDSSLSGYENLLVFAKLYDIPRRERSQRVHDAIAYMGMQDAADRLVRTYSGGMIRRLEIAQAVLHRPPVLFLDEPTVGLDPVARKAVWERINTLRNQYGTTILLTTHLMEEADSLCHRVAIMNRGVIVAIGTPAELKTSIGGKGITLDDVFVHYTGNSLDSGGSYRDISRQRHKAARLG